MEKEKQVMINHSCSFGKFGKLLRNLCISLQTARKYYEILHVISLSVGFLKKEI